MTEALDAWHSALVAAELALAAVTFVALWLISAPYGRHERGGWGPTIPSRLGWVVMESPSVLLFGAVFALGAHAGELVPTVMCGLWLVHYVHRTYIYPARIRATGKRMPIAIAALAFAFTSLNATVNAWWISQLGDYPTAWLTDPRFLIGAALFAAGLAANLHSDEVLRNLRKPGERGYKVPRGGLHELVAAPNYLGELVEWTGWAILTWSPAGLAFAVYTAANLVPRAHTHWQWAREHLPGYPLARRRLIPWLW